MTWWDSDPVVSSQSSGPTRITVTPERQASPYATAISSVESGGNYKAVGPVTRTGDRAFGKYQVMGANIGPWTKETLGRELSKQEFMSSPEAQDAVFEAKFGGYADKYGPEGAAKAWFAGEGGMNDPNRRDMLGTSVADYGRKFLSALGPSSAQAAERPSSPGGGGGGNWWESDPVVMAVQPQASVSAQEPATPPQVAPQGRQIGQGEALGRGAASGLTANFSDELRGLVEAGGAAPNEPAGLWSLLKGGYLKATGDPEADRRYNTAVAREREAGKLAGEQWPKTSIAGNVAGAVALPVGGALSASTLPGRMVASSAIGGTYGALSGAGEGEGLTDRASRAATGAAIGAGVGAVAPPIISGISAVGGLANQKLVEPIRNALRGQKGVEQEASRRALGSITEDVRNTGAAGVQRLQELDAARRTGMPVANIDMGGELTRGVARSAADTSPLGRETLNKTIDERFKTQFGRVSEWINDNFHYPNAEAQQRAIDAAQKTTNNPAYARAMSQPGAQGLWDEGFEQLASAPPVQNAIRQAMVTARSSGALEGLPPTRSPFILDKQTGALTLRVDENGNRVLPNLHFWDAVKKNLDKMGAEGQSFSRVLRQHLDELVPEYKTARSVAKGFFDAEDALGAGQNFVSLNKGLAESRRAFTELKPDEKRLFQDGFLSRFMEMLGGVGDRRDILNKINGNPNARSKLEMVLGREKWTELETRLRVEGIFDLSRSAVQGNSTTSRTLYNLGLAGGSGVGGIGIYSTDPQTVAVGAIVGLLSYRGQKVDERISRRVAELLASHDPRVLAQGIKAVAKNNRFLDAFRRTDTQISRLAGQQSTGGPALQGPVPGRADEEQPKP